jgi:hypothetical protein
MIINKGQVLPIYDNLRDQWRFRSGIKDWGIPSDTINGIPWLLYTSTGATDIEVFLVKVETEDVIQFSGLSNLEQYAENSGSGRWYGYDGGTFVDYIGEAVPCGLWYYRFNLDGETYFSEVMRFEKLGGYEKAILNTPVCDPGGFDFVGNDTLASNRTFQTIEGREFGVSTWTTLGSATGSIGTVGAVGETKEFLIRRRIETEAGNRLSTIYYLRFEVDDPCNGWVWFEYDQSNEYKYPEFNTVQFWDDYDTDDVVYQFGWKQKIYLPITYPDFPEPIREEELRPGANAVEVVSSSNTKEAIRFETPRIPDFWVTLLSIIKDADNIRITRAQDGDEYTPLEFGFSSREEVNDLESVGVFEYVREVFENTGPDSDKDLIESPIF